MTRPLTGKQTRFCQEYLVDLNGAAAATRAGYSKASAHVTASRMLANPQVQARIAELQKALSAKTGITVERVLAEYEKLAFSNMQDYITVQQDGTAFIDLSRLTRDQAAAISYVAVDEDSEPLDEGDDKDDPAQVRMVRKVKIKLVDKKGALDSLAKHLGMLTEKHEHSGKDGGPFIVEVRSYLDLPQGGA